MSLEGGVRYAHSGGVDIAYETFGEGDRHMVYVPGFVSHLDLMWDTPTFAALRRRFGSFARVTVFDKRGTGLSSRTLGFGSLAERMDDIRVVMDAANIERADFFGISEGGPLAMLFAASFPERVSSLCLYGTLVRGLWAPDFPAGVPADVGESFVLWLEENWGSGRGLSVFINGAPDSPEVTRMFARFERSACTPALVADILRNNLSIDIRDLLSTISARCLVLHMRDDPLISLEQAKFIGQHIPGAEFKEGDGDFHMPWDARRMTWVFDQVEEFIAGPAPIPPSASRPVAPDRKSDQPSRALATVLFTDIVGSTERAAAMGDRAWSARLDEHDRLSTEAVAQHAGRIVKTTGDGVVAVFDSPSRAVECARNMTRSLQAADLPVRAGVHTGEVEIRGTDIGGVGVHIASRVNGIAAEGEVWVSRTVRDLISGSGIELEPRGTHTLKGFEEPWDLYVACN